MSDSASGRGDHRGSRQARRSAHYAKARSHSSGERRRGGTPRHPNPNPNPNPNSPTGVHDSRFSSPERSAGGSSSSGANGSNWRNRSGHRRGGHRNRQRDADSLSPSTAPNGTDWPFRPMPMNLNCPDYHVFDVFGGGGLQLMPGSVPVESLARMGFVLPLPWMHPEHLSMPHLVAQTGYAVAPPHQNCIYGHQPRYQHQHHHQLHRYEQHQHQHQQIKRSASPSSTLTDTDGGHVGSHSDS